MSRDTRFAWLVALAVIAALVLIMRVAVQRDVQASRACEARGGKHVSGHGIDLCIDPRVLR